MSRLNPFLLLLVLLWASAAQASTAQVVLLMGDTGDAYAEFAESFAVEAARRNLSFSILQGNASLANAELVVAVGVSAAHTALNSNVPVLCVLLSKSSFEKLQHDLRAGRSISLGSAIYMDQPVKRQLELINVALPQSKHIGVLSSAQSGDMPTLRKAVAESRFVLHEEHTDSPESIHRNLQSILQDSDVLLTIPDAQIYNTMTLRNILLTTYRSRVPVIGLSPAYVKAGALCAVFSTPSQIAPQAVTMAKQFLESGHLSAAQYPGEFEVMVNQQVAHSLGLEMKDNALLLAQIKAAGNILGKNK